MMQKSFWLGLLLCACALLLGCPSNSSTPNPDPNPPTPPTITLNTPAGGIMMGAWASVTATFSGNVPSTTQVYTVTASDNDTVSPGACSISIAATTCLLTLTTHWNTSLSNNTTYTHSLTFTPASGSPINVAYTMATPVVYLSQTGDAPTDSGAGVPFAPSGRFTVIAGHPGCIHDNLTNLTWVANLNTVPINGSSLGANTTFTNAVISISNINTNSADYLCSYTSGGWRLPTVSELYSLIDYTQQHPQDWLNNGGFGFSNVQGYYWSSNVYGPTPSADAWYVNMDSTGVVTHVQGYSGYVWPVRVGQ